jgi:hypothetical protein
VTPVGSAAASARRKSSSKDGAPSANLKRKVTAQVSMTTQMGCACADRKVALSLIWGSLASREKLTLGSVPEAGTCGGTAGINRSLEGPGVGIVLRSDRFGAPTPFRARLSGEAPERPRDAPPTSASRIGASDGSRPLVDLGSIRIRVWLSQTE